MGRLEQFAQRTFAEETDRITGGGIGWEDPPEIRLEKVQADGLLVVHRPQELEHLTPPWPEARFDAEVMIELKLTGNHVDRSATERALLRRQARQVQRVEQNPRWFREEPLWLVAPRLPRWLERTRSPVLIAPGCYWVDPQWHSFLWIAANELPLVDELIPFLLARSGRALDEFGRWVASRRPLDWMMDMLELVPMSAPTMEEMMERWGPALDEPEVEARRQRILQFLLKTSPAARQGLIDEGQLCEARQALRQVLARRQLLLSPAEDARIEGCEDLATVRRWHDQAITAHSTAEALR
jgi:hypothetical protein